MNYRLTDHSSMLHALQRVVGKEGRSGAQALQVQAVDADETVTEDLLLRTDHPAEETIVFTFRDNILRVRVQPVEELIYKVKDILIEPATRQSVRVESKVLVTEVLGTPPVDIASSIALYGKTSSIAKTCQMGKMHLMNHLNARGFMVSDCRIGFYYSADMDLYHRLETSGHHMFVVDALKRAVHSGKEYEHPLVGLPESRHEDFFTGYARDKIRSHYVYTFRDQVGTVMGFVEFRSTMAGLGQKQLVQEEGREKTLKLFEIFLFEQCVDLVFQMEMFSVKQWIRLGSQEDLLDISENGRGARLHVRSKETERVLRQGSKVRFNLELGGQAHTFTATVRSVKPVDDGFAIGLRVHRGSADNSLHLLGLFAKSRMPKLSA